MGHLVKPSRDERGKGIDAQFWLCANLSFLAFSVYYAGCDFEIHNFPSDTNSIKITNALS